MATKLPPGERLLASLRDGASLAENWALAKAIARRPKRTPAAPPKAKA